MVVMTPKSLLRHPEVVSPLDELTDRSFQKILADDLPDASQIKRVLCCSGKVYYDLKKGRQEAGRDNVAILRFEQLYPLLESEIAAALAPYKAELPVVWVQEEPENMGAWGYLRLRFGSEMAGRDLQVVARAPSASPATGSASAHRLEQQQVIDRALGADE